jgi:hypothetical protein
MFPQQIFHGIGYCCSRVQGLQIHPSKTQVIRFNRDIWNPTRYVPVKRHKLNRMLYCSRVLIGFQNIPSVSQFRSNKFTQCIYFYSIYGKDFRSIYPPPRIISRRFCRGVDVINGLFLWIRHNNFNGLASTVLIVNTFTNLFIIAQ